MAKKKAMTEGNRIMDSQDLFRLGMDEVAEARKTIARRIDRAIKKAAWDGYGQGFADAMCMYRGLPVQGVYILEHKYGPKPTTKPTPKRRKK